MKNSKFLWLKLLIMGLVLVLSFWLRNDKYESIPSPGESLDEYSYSWVGMSLIETGVPIGISGIDGYEDSSLEYINVDRIYQKASGRATPLTISKPWFDHPPLLGLMTGGYAYLKGARSFEEASTFLIRKPMVIVGVISVLLVMVLGWLMFGYEIGLVVGILYGSSPVVVISSRMIQAENALVPISLMVLIFLGLFLKYKNKKAAYWAFAWAGVAMLFKVSGVYMVLACILSVMFLGKVDGKIKLLFEGLLISLAIAILFVIYGVAIDADMFFRILGSNGNRFYGIGPGLFFNLISQSKITGLVSVTDGWILTGWIASLIGMFEKKIGWEKKLLGVMLLSYLSVFTFFGSEFYGWYTFPFWPLLFLFLASLLTKRKDMFGVVLILLIPIGFLMSRLWSGEEFAKVAMLWRVGIPAMLIGFLAMRLLKIENKRLSWILRWSLVGVVLFLNISFLRGITIDSWYTMW